MLKEDQVKMQKPSSSSSSSSMVFNSVLSSTESRSNPVSDNNVASNPLEGQALGLLSQLLQSGQTSSLPSQVASGIPALPPLQPNSFGGLDNSNTNQLFLDLVHSSNHAQLSNNGALRNMPMGDGDRRDDKSKLPAKGPKPIIKSGRKSDPRMDAAVEAKMNDPDLSLVDALRRGGFVFPNIDDTNAPQYTVVDSDNVKITQRKNQLLRRLRSMKKKS